MLWLERFDFYIWLGHFVIFLLAIDCCTLVIKCFFFHFTFESICVHCYQFVGPSHHTENILVLLCAFAAEKIMFLPFSPVPTTYLVLGTSFIGWLPKIILFAERAQKRQKWKHPIEEIVCFLEKLILRKLFLWASAPTPLFSPENVL